MERVPAWSRMSFRPRHLLMTTPILYYPPDTGEIRADVFAYAMPLPDCTVGVVAPALIRCQIHCAYEPLGRITKAPAIQGYTRMP